MVLRAEGFLLSCMPCGLLWGNQQGGGAQSTCGGHGKRRIGAALCKTIWHLSGGRGKQVSVFDKYRPPSPASATGPITKHSVLCACAVGNQL